MTPIFNQSCVGWNGLASPPAIQYRACHGPGAIRRFTAELRYRRAIQRFASSTPACSPTSDWCTAKSRLPSEGVDAAPADQRPMREGHKQCIPLRPTGEGVSRTTVRQA